MICISEMLPCRQCSYVASWFDPIRRPKTTIPFRVGAPLHASRDHWQSAEGALSQNDTKIHDGGGNDPSPGKRRNPHSPNILPTSVSHQSQKYKKNPPSQSQRKVFRIQLEVCPVLLVSWLQHLQVLHAGRLPPGHTVHSYGTAPEKPCRGILGYSSPCPSNKIEHMLLGC